LYYFLYPLQHYEPRQEYTGEWIGGTCEIRTLLPVEISLDTFPYFHVFIRFNQIPDYILIPMILSSILVIEVSSTFESLDQLYLHT